MDIEDKKYILDYNSEWLKFADQKATVIITVFGVLLTIVYTNPVEVLVAIKQSEFIFWVTIVTGGTSLASIVFSFLCLKPSLKNNNQKSMIYFKNIGNFKDWGEYKDYCREKDFGAAIDEQIYTISEICSKKYRYVGISLIFFFITIGLLLSLVLFYAIL